MSERAILDDWVLQVLKTPKYEISDPTDAGLTRAFARISENEQRWLRVVYRRAVQEDFL
jgi:hypothetical protein